MAALSSMARDALVPGEQIGGFIRWQFGSVVAEEAKPTDGIDPEAVREAQRLGFDEGLAAGRAEALAEAQTRMDDYLAGQGRALAERFAALFSAAQRRFADAEQIMARGTLEIACALARQVLRHELATNPNTLEPVVREALGMLLADGKSARVRLSQTDFDMLGDPLRAEFEGQSVVVVADAAIEPGDCLVESAGAVIDGGIARRWARAVASLGLSMRWLPERRDDV